MGASVTMASRSSGLPVAKISMRFFEQPDPAPVGSAEEHTGGAHLGHFAVAHLDGLDAVAVAVAGEQQGDVGRRGEGRPDLLPVSGAGQGQVHGDYDRAGAGAPSVAP